MSVYLAAERMMNPDESISDDSAESILKKHGYFQNDIEFTLGRGYRFIEALIHFGYSNAEIQKQLKAMGYDGVDASYGKENKTGQYVIFDPEQVKSADLVTYDDEGNIIPLSERFRTDGTDAEAWKNEDIRYSVREIIGNGGKNYGVGVKLDSTLLANLSPEERIQMVKEYVKELGGKEFSAFDNDGNAVSVRIAESNRRFMNKNGKRVRVNNDLVGKYIGNEVKQEAISLVDELIVTSKNDSVKPAKYSHGWLDNNGKNAWQYWTTFIQDKENTVWKATLNIANTAYGEKVLYDINPIEMVEQSVKSDTVSTNDSIAQKSNTVNTIISEKSKNSTEKYSDRDYSYDNLVSKPDMKVTQIGTEAPSNRADIVFEAKRNASKIGKFNVKDGSVSVYVDDIGTDVILGTDGLKHGLRRSKNISTDINSLAILNAGEIIKHSVKINELIPKDKNATSSYVLIGCAENSSSRFIVRSIINTFDNSLSKMDVLYAVKVKESAAQPAPGSAAKAVSSVTDSKISITDLLEIVNRHYPDILPESVLKHFGYSERPSGDLAVSALYSFRDTKSGMANDKLSPYGEELSQFIEQKGDYIVDNFDKLKQVVNLAFDNPSVKATAYFGIINRETLSEIKESIPNLPKASKEILFKDGRDYSIATTLDSIRHIVDEKGLSRDDVIDYLDRLADTVVDFDTVSFDYYYDSYKNRIPGLLFKKSFEDGKLISFDIVSQKKRSLSLQAIYLESVDYEKKKSAETLLLQNSHSRTPEVGVGQTSDNRVAQFDDNVKGKIEKSLDSDCDGVVKDATQLTEGDLRYLLEQIQEGELDTGYIPVARTTPQFYIDVVNEHSKGKTEVMKVPLASSVEHMMQNMEEYDGSTYEDDKTPHGLSTDDIITISKEMIHPKYIVLQRNGRYAEVVSFFSEKRKKQVVLSIDFAEDGESPKNFKHEQYMNGYNGGYYNIIVTEYEPTDLKSYLKNNEIVYDRQRMNGKYQVGSGRIVTVTHDTPFIQKDNTTVSDKSQEEALDKKQSKKKNLKDIEPTNYLNPNRIIPVNNITDKEKYEYLVSEFDKNGYSGRPVVVVTEDGFADDSSSMYSAVTGSHRILAATEAEIDVPVYEIHMNDENAERIMELVDANEDSERARIAKELFEDGIISEEAYSLIEREDELNYENDDVSYSEQLRYSERDFPIDVDIAKTVSDAVKNRGKGGNHILSDITPEQNKAINRLAVNNDYYRGKFTGGKHFFTDNFINHALKEHGDFLVEGLRGQLPIINDDVARNLTAIRQNKKSSLTISSKTRMGNASILTVYKVNGYTLYAEEILRPSENNKVGNLIGHTMYKAPTLSTAAFNTTSVVTQPERQGTVLCEYNNTRKNGLSRGNFISDKAGNPAALKYVITERGIDFDVRSGLIALSSDEKNFTKNGEKVETGYVLSNKPFYITAKNTVFRNSEENYSTKVRELKQQGYDSFIFDYNTGDNYIVAVVSKAQIVTDKPAVVKTERHSDRDYSYDNLVSKPDMRVTQIGTEAPSNRADIVFEAKRNASKIGKFNVKDGSVSVYVDDIGTDVVIGKKGLLHGLHRGKELSTKATVTVKIGEILKNSIKVNEATPKDSAADRTYVLIGCATDNINTYVVRSIINTFSSELQSVDVLYAVNTKKETAVSETPRVSTPSTVSTVSITDLLDYVNRCFPEVLSADVLKHFGHESRPEGNPKGLGESMLYSDRDGNAKDATQLTESDLRYLLEQIQEGELDTGYIPVARTTPQFYIDVVNEHSKGKTEVMKVPLASSVEHMMQNMEEYDGSTYEDDKTPHGLSTDDIITISKEMIHPKYIVLQRNGRYAEVVSFFSEKRKKQVVLSIDFAEDGESPKNFKHEQYMNGYNGGYYNIIVTEYEPTDLKSYLKNNEIVYDRQRMNGKYQVGSGRIVTVTHDTPFIQKDNTTVSDKSQEEALDKKQSKKKNLKDIEPTNYLNPNRIIPVNNITDKEKYEYLVSEFDKNGYSGRPVVVVTEDGFADDSSSMYSAVTGSHRILAATEAEIDVPVYEIHMNDENAERIMELVDANEDSERARIAKELFEDGIISEEAYSLIEREDELNYENDDVSYSEQLRYSDRDEGLKDFVEKRKNSILSEYGIDRIGDYVQVQKRVYQGLREKGFFTNEEKTSRKDVNEASGMIVYTNRKGINETFNYGNFAKSSNALKLLKILTVEKIPELIQNGQLIDDNVENFHGLKNEFAYISGKVNIDGLDINMWLAIKKTEAKNRFWVHYVGIKSDIDETTSTGSNNSRMAFRNTNVANGDYTISKLKSQEEAFDKLYSDRDITLSSRYLLANALESTARNEVERDWLGRYKADIEKYNAEQDKLTTLNAQIKELSFGKGKRDMTKLRQLRDEKIKTENRITIYDKRLLRIETAKPLQNVIEREKTKAKNKALQQGREALEAYKKTAVQKLREEVALRKEPFCRPRLFKF